ncbi:hypothetical protein L3Y34_004853 [Caenorhabditis briggsae]|nr:hypothetical protein L3Y34_004853 [Caenorhabditis briggsae]
MLGIPKTPKRVVRSHSRDLYQPRFRIEQPTSPLSKSHLLGFTLPLKQHILQQKSKDLPIPNPFPINTSTPKHKPPDPAISTHHSPLFSIKEPAKIYKRRSELQYQNVNALPKILDVDEDELREEVALEDSDVIVLSPEPRPVSAPLIKKALYQPKLPPRPRTAEPVEQKPAKIAVCNPVPKQRTVPKLTVTKTPHCARPTASWLARIKSNREDCKLKAPIFE